MTNPFKAEVLAHAFSPSPWRLASDADFYGEGDAGVVFWDASVFHCVRELVRKWPDARVVYTHRDRGEWLSSIRWKLRPGTRPAPVSVFAPRLLAENLSGWRPWRLTDAQLTLAYDQQKAACEAMGAYVVDPSHRTAWLQLCEAVDEPLPGQMPPFPHENRRPGY